MNRARVCNSKNLYCLLALMRTQYTYMRSMHHKINLKKMCSQTQKHSPNGAIDVLLYLCVYFYSVWYVTNICLGGSIYTHTFTLLQADTFILFESQTSTQIRNTKDSAQNSNNKWDEWKKCDDNDSNERWRRRRSRYTLFRSKFQKP